MCFTNCTSRPNDGDGSVLPFRVYSNTGDARIPSGIPLMFIPEQSAKGTGIRLVWQQENSWFCQLEVHLLFSERTIWLSTGTKLEFKRGRDTPIDAVDTILSVWYFVICLRFVLLSYVSQWRWREQRSWRHSELGVADRSEGDIMKEGWSCSWLAWLRYLSCLSCCVHGLSLLLEIWNLMLWVISWTCGMIELSWQMMRTWEETQTESESN